MAPDLSACVKLVDEYTAVVTQLERAQAVVRRIERERLRVRGELLKVAHGSKWEVTVHENETAPAAISPEPATRPV